MTPPQKALIVGVGGYLGHALGSAYARHGWETYGLIRNKNHTNRLAASEITPIHGSLDDASLPGTLEAEAKYFNVVVFSLDQFWDFLSLLDSIVRVSRAIAEFSGKHGVKPLVFFTSGMKDFGETGLDGSPGLRPLTEEDPLNPPQTTRERAVNCEKILEHGDVFDAAVIRPPNLYGLSGSGYGYFFKLAERAKQTGAALELPADARTILHSMHVEDCAEAYIALSQPDIRDKVRQQVFNIAASRYETLGEIVDALVREYDLTGGVRFKPEDRKMENGLDFFIVGFSEWISSEKIRRVTGWTDKRALLSEKIHLYRRAYEAAIELGNQDVQRMVSLSDSLQR